MRVLVVLIEAEGADAVVPVALEEAEAGGKCTVLQLCDGNYTDKLCGKLRQDGWMGGRQSEEVGQAVGREYLQRFDLACASVARLLRENGLDVRQLSRGGDLVNTVLQVADEEGDVGAIIIGQPERHWLTAWFKGVNTRILTKILNDRASCGVKFVSQPREE